MFYQPEPNLCAVKLFLGADDQLSDLAVAKKPFHTWKRQLCQDDLCKNSHSQTILHEKGTAEFKTVTEMPKQDSCQLQRFHPQEGTLCPLIVCPVGIM